ncbi:tetratricopeptide repeat protein [Brevifollis gellanilyticus]|uniref:NACHT domain-containing protein n=1 Tax=Brevifollis gellanilyticus TaxID=748831 RepID=A0A512MFP3_9BACT|nr:tetratricopeptide repeat protein [Brevifollis gellanilyticus]GEP45547.1 hypothetical protein BGE01nite_48380 [Brevifollis gellanilyticus]
MPKPDPAQQGLNTQNSEGAGNVLSGRDTHIREFHNHIPGQKPLEPPKRLTYGLSTSAHEGFIGRADLLKQLMKELKPGKRAVILPARAIHADGGVGKTSLAAHLGWLLFEKEVFDYVLFLGAATRESLESEISRLCERDNLNLPSQAAKEQEPRYREVLAFLKAQETARRTLLILDGADEKPSREFVHELRKELPSCAFLITSRHADWGKGIDGFPLDLFSEPEALAFLRDRLSSLTASDKTLSGVAQALDHLPLGLEIAASYIRDAHLTPAAWLAEWQQTPSATLSHHNPDHLEYPLSLARVWDQSVARLPGRARALLHILAWIAPRPAALSLKPFEVLEGWPQLRGDLDLLSKASLIRWEADPSQVLVHRLLQTCMRAAFSTEERQASLTACLNILKATLPDPDWSQEGWQTWTLLSPHLQTIIAATEHPEFQPIETSLTYVLNQFALWLRNRAQHAEAEPLQRRALKIDEASQGPDHPTVAIRLNNLAQVLQATNRANEAEQLMRRALKIDEALYGPTHTTVAVDLNNLATLLYATNRLGEAERLMRRSLKIVETSYGPDHFDVARDLNNLAQLLQDTNRPAEAEPLHHRALKIVEATFGPDHPRVAISLNNLAQLLQATNRLREAEEPMRRALKIDEASYGPDHPEVAVTLNNLAQLLKDMNRPGEAKEPMRRTVDIFVRFTAQTGHEHPHLRAALDNYFTLLLESGQTEGNALQSLVSALMEGGMSHEQIENVLPGEASSP